MRELLWNRLANNIAASEAELYGRCPGRSLLANLVAVFPLPFSKPESYDVAANGSGPLHGHGKNVYAGGRVSEGVGADHTAGLFVRMI